MIQVTMILWKLQETSRPTLTARRRFLTSLCNLRVKHRIPIFRCFKIHMHKLISTDNESMIFTSQLEYIRIDDDRIRCSTPVVTCGCARRGVTASR